jgi:hypothetical protein
VSLAATDARLPPVGGGSSRSVRSELVGLQVAGGGQVPAGPGWTFEVKFDGVRAIGYRRADGLAFVQPGWTSPHLPGRRSRSPIKTAVRRTHEVIVAG